MSFETVASFCLSSDSTEININLSPSIELDNRFYDNFLELTSYGYTNVFANIEEDLKTSSYWMINGVDYSNEIIINKGTLLDINQIIQKFNDYFNNLLILTLNSQTGYITLSFSTDVTSVNIVTNGSILTSQYIGLNNQTITEANPITSEKVPNISSFNYISILTNLATSNTYINDKYNNVIKTNIITTNSAAYSAFENVVLQSLYPHIYKINGLSVNNIVFKLVKQDSTDLTIISGSSTDFTVNFSIIRRLK